MGNKVATVTPVVTGAVNTMLGTPTGIQVFAGPRDDPFFIDLEQFFRILPDRKPVTGPLPLLRAHADPSRAVLLPAAGQAVDYVNGFNVLSIVIELPSSMIENGAPGKLGIWGTISR